MDQGEPSEHKVQLGELISLHSNFFLLVVWSGVWL